MDTKELLKNASELVENNKDTIKEAGQKLPGVIASAKKMFGGLFGKKK